MKPTSRPYSPYWLRRPKTTARPWVAEAVCLAFGLPLIVFALLALAWHWWKLALVASVPTTRRLAAATLLLFYKPRPIDGRLYTLCNS